VRHDVGFFVFLYFQERKQEVLSEDNAKRKRSQQTAKKLGDKNKKKIEAGRIGSKRAGLCRKTAK
jgi:hypothetical protein